MSVQTWFSFVKVVLDAYVAGTYGPILVFFVILSAQIWYHGQIEATLNYAKNVLKWIGISCGSCCCLIMLLICSMEIYYLTYVTVPFQPNTVPYPAETIEMMESDINDAVTNIKSHHHAGDPLTLPYIGNDELFAGFIEYVTNAMPEKPTVCK